MGKLIKTFEDLEFKDHPTYKGGKLARIDFEHGHFISVIYGHDCIQCGNTTFEVYSGHENGRKTCKGYRTRRQVTERMRYLQRLEER